MKPMSINDIYPAASDDCIDLLKKMLVFNPSTRITINEALEHPYFDEIREKEYEDVFDGKLAMPFD